MDDTIMVMMKIKTPEKASPNTHNHNNNLNIPITTSISPTWKLYENPFYITHHHHHNKPHDHQLQDYQTTSQQVIHRLQLPIPARKIAASFFDLTFVKPPPLMESSSELEKVKSELEFERKARKKMESLNKKLVREISEERKGREAIERVCEELAKEISAHKSEFFKMKKEMEEERKMLRTAEVIREERVQIKLADAKFLLEEKFEELEIARKLLMSDNNDKKEANFNDHHQKIGQSKLVENPHIKRGIKGFVEFPKVVREIGCRSGKHLGSKLECQKAQLKILLKQKGPVLRFNSLIAS